MKITVSFRIFIVAVLILSALLVSCGGNKNSNTSSKKDDTTAPFEVETTEVGDVVEFPEIPIE